MNSLLLVIALLVPAPREYLTPSPLPAMDFAFSCALEESLMGWLPKGNLAFLEAMPPKASRACLKMQTSPYARVRDRGQQELLECGIEWQWRALHFPVPEVQARAMANLSKLSECTECQGHAAKHNPAMCGKCRGWGANTHEYDKCDVCLGIGVFWDYAPFLATYLEARAANKVMEEQIRINKQPGLID